MSLVLRIDFEFAIMSIGECKIRTSYCVLQLFINQ